ncbi:MAG: protein O-GlcNAc transferase, partial [Myxococcales bacterium]|nr:protein O-GlcNAc transferase [Myxococcales bacterium]
RAGLAELVAASADEYVRLAVSLAGDGQRDRLRGLRAGLRQRLVTSGLTDGPRFAAAFEDGLRTAWRDHCQREQGPSPAPTLPAGTALVPMTGGTQVAVADAINQLTTYVLTEQQDWFEDEIVFVRAAINRGERAIDIGANHGVYALSLARGVGADGLVWAFEPEPTAAARLRLAIAANRFANLTLVEMALSDHSGTGHLSAGTHSELAALADSDGDDGVDDRSPGYDVPLATLDEGAPRLGIRDVAFVKMDAEGSEPAIIDGARRFFAQESPLVMFEVRHGAAIHRPTVDAIARLGYERFRLVPGLMLLAPVDDPDALDPYQLNLFACKPDRAARLADRGLLVTRLRSADDAPAQTWLTHLRPLAVAKAFGAGWRGAAGAGAVEQTYFAALDHHALAQRPLDPPDSRYAHLMKAVELGAEALAQWPEIPVLQTVARLAWEAGFRAVAVQTLNTLVQRCLEAGDPIASVPFLPACPRFDHVAPLDDDLRRWVLAAAMEQRERLRAFSSFYTARDPQSRPTLETMAALGYQSPEMARRLALIKQLTA